MAPANAPKTIGGKTVGSIGFGMMNLTISDKISHEEAVKPMKAALDNGSNFWNAGTFYGPPTANSLHLLNYYFTKYPEDASRVVLSVKGAYELRNQAPDGSPEGLRSTVDECLRILNGTKTIDLFECARIDPEVPVETTVGALKQLIEDGKIGSYGLSEVSPATIRRANAVHPPAAVEEELSLFSRHVLDEGGVLDTCRELGIVMVGYSPMGSGWLTGQFKKLDDLAPDDYRRRFPRFQPGAFEHNVKLAQAVEAVAEKKGCSSAQIAIAWVVRQGVLAIPGATKVSRVEENCKSVDLTDAEAAEIQKAVDHTAVVGDRYPEAFQKHLSQ
ncbi:Aldo/keto reductase [Plenodomus tracheiphilus IPT5]|uniref:Aldo/keto reductase n=1 Tax=Plenodomus tracheiphilus IPT5 TaxID=1408161 RepID=A0A6A7BD75_9PLEO|nr:Aldo/keto reductase [Plenodomus tracheiphilus IPT5]